MKTTTTLATSAASPSTLPSPSPATLFATIIALLVAGGCAEKRLVGKRVDVEGFESAQRTKTFSTASPSSSKILLPAPVSVQDWRQEQFSALHTPPRLATAFAWQKRFRIATGSGRSRLQPLQATPIVAEGRLFALSTKGSVSAFDAATGQKAWQHKLRLRSKKNFGGGLAFAEGRVFVSTGGGVLAALDAETGELLWQEQLPFPLRSAPVIAGEKQGQARLLVVTPTYRTYAFNLDGTKLWEQQSTNDSLAQLTLSPSAGVAGRYAVVGYGDGSLVAMDTNNGRILWQAFATAQRRNDGLADIADITTPPVIASGLVYASSFSGKTVALDLASGALRWAAPLAALSSLALYGTTIFVVDQNSLLSALDATNGNVLWERQLTARFGRKKRKAVLWNGPLLAEDLLILSASNGEIVAVDARDGSLARRMRFSARFTATPVAAQGSLFFLDSQGNIHAFE